MNYLVRFPYAYIARDIFTGKTSYTDKVMVDVVEVDVPRLDGRDFPIVMRWRSHWQAVSMDGELPADSAECLIRHGHREGKDRFYAPFGAFCSATETLTADHLPGRDRHDHGAPGNDVLSHFVDTRSPNGSERYKAVKDWLGGRMKRQPTEADVVYRWNADRDLRRREAEDFASTLVVIDGIVYREIPEPKFLVASEPVHVDRAGFGMTMCPVISIHLGEAKVGEYWSTSRHVVDDTDKILPYAMPDIDVLLGRHGSPAAPLHKLFDDLWVADWVDFAFDRDLNARWRILGSVVDQFRSTIGEMDDSVIESWLRLRRVADAKESDVTPNALDDAYDDLVRLANCLDEKSPAKRRFVESLVKWEEAEIHIPDINHRRAP